MAAMSVIGIDLGNEACYVAVAKAGGIETIANDYSLRSTPSYIAFSDKNRVLGVAAKNQQITNMKNTVYGLKRLLGRKFRDPHVQREMEHLPFAVVERPDGGVGVKVRYLSEETVFRPEQCLGMLFTKLRETANIALETPINDCVISVPSYFTNAERAALMDAAVISGLNVLRLFNETTATALAYGIYKQDLPGPEEKPRNVVFVDWGHSALQVFAVAFHKDKLRVITSTSDPNLGGRDIDYILADHFCEDFLARYKVDGKNNPRAYVRLLSEVEKVKKQMSANSTPLPVNIECYMNDKDVHSEIKRADMEELCAPLFKRAEVPLRQCLEQSGLELEEIHSVEIVGGSTRIPAIKQLIEKVFKVEPKTSLNQDEAVSRGCALQCAMLSPAVRVREFSVKDVQNYSISVAWGASSDGEAAGEIEAFPVNQTVPFSKMLTFYRKEPFAIQAYYSGPVPYPEKSIGSWFVKEVRPNAEGKSQKVKVKVRINLHGLMAVSSASLYEAKESGEPEAPEETPQAANGPADDTAEQQTEGDAPMADGTNNAAPEDGDKDKKKKQVVKSVDLPIEAVTTAFTTSEINKFIEHELNMISADRQEKERVDARNALEEYVYELRGKIGSETDLYHFVLESDRKHLTGILDDMEYWLYEGGEDCQRQVYQDKLVELKGEGEPIQTRKVEFELRPHVLEDLSKTLQQGMKALDLIRGNDARYAHLSEEEVKKVDQTVKLSHQWLEQTRAKLVTAPKHLPPPITVAQIRQEKNSFEGAIGPILNKPPPKAPTPPQEAKADEKSTKQEQPTQEDKMEWSTN